MDYFNRLAALTYRHWNTANRDDAALPQAAMRALAELPAHEHIRASDVVEWAATTPALPLQLDPQSQFGDPPLTVYNDGCLVIDIYFWLHSSTSIHQHAFAGVEIAHQVVSQRQDGVDVVMHGHAQLAQLQRALAHHVAGAVDEALAKGAVRDDEDADHA